MRAFFENWLATRQSWRLCTKPLPQLYDELPSTAACNGQNPRTSATTTPPNMKYTTSRCPKEDRTGVHPPLASPPPESLDAGDGVVVAREPAAHPSASAV